MGRPARASFFEELARTHRVVRYDRMGVGLSDRGLATPPRSSRTAYARRGARRVRRRAGTLFALLVRGPGDGELRERDFPERVEQARVLRRLRGARRHPGGNASLDRRLRPGELVAGVADARGAPRPTASGDEIAAFSRYHATARRTPMWRRLPRGRPRPPTRARAAATSTTPALVLHRRGDRAVPIGRDGSLRRCSRTPASSR